MQTPSSSLHDLLLIWCARRSVLVVDTRQGGCPILYANERAVASLAMERTAVVGAKLLDVFKVCAPPPSLTHSLSHTCPMSHGPPLLRRLTSASR